MDITDGGPASPEPEPQIIGLTGGIGSGKTTVAKFIENMGFPVYYSDIRAKEIVNDNPILKEEIIALLGPSAYDTDSRYNRKFVSGQVFKNEALLRSLNELIHPAVRVDFEEWTNKQKTDYIFKETALLFELGLDKECYKTLLVTAEDNIRMKRVMDRDRKTYREIEAVMDKQMPEKDKIKLADFVIYNNEGLAELEAETLQTVEQLNRQ